MDAIHVSLEEFFSKRLVFKKKNTKHVHRDVFILFLFYSFIIIIFFFWGGTETHVRDHF